MAASSSIFILVNYTGMAFAITTRACLLTAREKWPLCLHTHYTNSNINLKYNIYGEKVDSNEPRGAAAAMANTTAAASLCTHPCAFCSLLVMYCHTLLKPF